jgi:hypothetical protein
VLTEQAFTDMLGAPSSAAVHGSKPEIEHSPSGTRKGGHVSDQRELF